MTRSSKKPKGLIVGGTGMLGRGIARQWLAAGWEVTLVSRGRIPVPPDLVDCPHWIRSNDPGATLGELVGDETFDMVVDAAVYGEADAIESIQAFRESAARYCFISTDYVYAADSAASYPLDTAARTQTDTDYAKNKLTAESRFLEAHARNGFPVTILRPPHILGEGKPLGCDPAAGGRSPNLPQRILAGETIPLIDAGRLLIQPVWSREVGQYCLSLREVSESQGKILNCVGGAAVSTLHYYETVARLLDRELRVKPVPMEDYLADHPDQRHYLRHRLYDLSLLRQYAPLPKLSLIDALRETLEPFLAKP